MQKDEKPMKDQVQSDIKTGFWVMMSGFGAGMDNAEQNKAPLNYRDTRDPRDYRSKLSAAKDQLLHDIRLADPETKTQLILSYRFLQRYHKVNPRPISDSDHALRVYLSNRMDQQIKPDTIQSAQKSYFDSLFDIQQYVTSTLASLRLPRDNLVARLEYFPHWNRLSTLNKAEKDKQIEARPQFQDLTQGFANATLPQDDTRATFTAQVDEFIQEAKGKNPGI